MIKLVAFYTLLVCLHYQELSASNLPGPLVYVVTPSPKSARTDEGRSAPFYYHNWMRRMDSPRNATVTTTTPAQTPDLIFAEFEADRMKNIRKLLEQERVKPKSTTTSAPIYVPDEDMSYESQSENYGLHLLTAEKKEESNQKDTIDYFASYNNMYHDASNQPAPVYESNSATSLEEISSSPSTTTTTPSSISNVENIWHIIDNEKHNQYSGQWEEIPVHPESTDESDDTKSDSEDNKTSQDEMEEEVEDVKLDENFALPGFGTNPGNGAENESRAIRTEPNIRFPYVNLKPFKMKNLKKPVVNTISSSKKGNNMYTNLDNFYEIKNPVRGEAQDVVLMRQPVDRYNPAQPYLPLYGGVSKSKPSGQSNTPYKAVANLVPPPPPPATADDFPVPSTYESFPPYPPSNTDSNSSPLLPSGPPNPMTMSQPSADSSDSAPSDPSDNSNDGPSIDAGYQYQPPSDSGPKFLPTLPPLQKPFGGYSYDKPMMTVDSPPPMGKPGFNGYHYDKPAPPAPEKPDFHGYHYGKPEPLSPPVDHPPSYGHHGPTSHDSDYPELIYDKPHGGGGGGGDMKGGNDMKDAGDMGMVPPPPPSDMTKPGMDAPSPSMDDNGFPHDFPSDLKYHHDFGDHDFYHHHHHHHTTTTTTTTEMPRVNRYSYYYLGKKLYYLPLYFSVYFIIYVGALIIKAVLRHKIVYPNSWRPNDQTASFFSKRSVDSWDVSNENLHEVAGKVTHAIATAAEKYMNNKNKQN